MKTKMHISYILVAGLISMRRSRREGQMARRVNEDLPLEIVEEWRTSLGYTRDLEWGRVPGVILFSNLAINI